ncbi:MAG: hypothetical protein H6550_15910 [Chitinophagales bacterium]|nr:hypothetical protein [Chitinophagales bacterium]
MYFYLTVGQEGLPLSLTEFEGMSLGRIRTYIRLMDEHYKRIKDAYDAARNGKPKN